MNGVDGVVLVVIQITYDPSAERTAPPRSTHMQPGDVSHCNAPDTMGDVTGLHVC